MCDVSLVPCFCVACVGACSSPGCRTAVLLLSTGSVPCLAMPRCVWWPLCRLVLRGLACAGLACRCVQSTHSRLCVVCCSDAALVTDGMVLGFRACPLPLLLLLLLLLLLSQPSGLETTIQVSTGDVTGWKRLKQRMKAGGLGAISREDSFSHEPYDLDDSGYLGELYQPSGGGGGAGTGAALPSTVEEQQDSKAAHGSSSSAAAAAGRGAPPSSSGMQFGGFMGASGPMVVRRGRRVNALPDTHTAHRSSGPSLSPSLVGSASETKAAGLKLPHVHHHHHVADVSEPRSSITSTVVSSMRFSDRGMVGSGGQVKVGSGGDGDGDSGSSATSTATPDTHNPQPPKSKVAPNPRPSQPQSLPQSGATATATATTPAKPHAEAFPVPQQSPLPNAPMEPPSARYLARPSQSSQYTPQQVQLQSRASSPESAESKPRRPSATSVRSRTRRPSVSSVSRSERRDLVGTEMPSFVIDDDDGVHRSLRFHPPRVMPEQSMREQWEALNMSSLSGVSSYVALVRGGCERFCFPFVCVGGGGCVRSVA